MNATSPMNRDLPIVLLIEDDEDDSFLLVRALQKAGVNNPIQVIGNACDVFPCLEAARRGFRKLLVVISLDIFLSAAPSILKWIRDQSEWFDVPIVAVGNSGRMDDIQRAYDLGANAYFAKRLDVNELARLIRELEFFEAPMMRHSQNR